MMDNLLANILTAQIKTSQSASNRVEEILQDQATDARLAVVDILDALWTASDKSDSLALNRLAQYKESQFGHLRKPFYHETDEYHEMIKGIEERY